MEKVGQPTESGQDVNYADQDFFGGRVRIRERKKPCGWGNSLRTNESLTWPFSRLFRAG